MQKERNRSMNMKIAAIYFSILIGTQIAGISFVLTNPTFLSVLVVGLVMIIALPTIAGVVLVSAVKSKYKKVLS